MALTVGNLYKESVKYHMKLLAGENNGGVPKDELANSNMEALKKGIANLEKHIENIHKFGVPIVVTLNKFSTDTEEELDFVKNFCEERNCEFALSEVWEKGGEGGVELTN
jgi:formate--tetrahydrofolate ligase